MATPVLITSKYVPVGTYIGQIIRPRPAAVAVDARYPAIIGKGNRLALGRNILDQTAWIQSHLFGHANIFIIQTTFAFSLGP